jgi:hypothetical protein
MVERLGERRRRFPNRLALVAGAVESRDELGDVAGGDLVDAPRADLT